MSFGCAAAAPVPAGFVVGASSSTAPPVFAGVVAAGFPFPLPFCAADVFAINGITRAADAITNSRITEDLRIVISSAAENSFPPLTRTTVFYI